MRKVGWLVLFASIAGLLASAGGCHRDKPEGKGGGGAGTTAVCADDRWIRALPDGKCPLKDVPDGESGWEVTQLFPGTDKSDDTTDDALSAYCLYEWKGPLPADTSKLPQQGNAPGLDRDCAVVAPLGDAADAAEEIRLELLTAFLQQVEVPTMPVTPGNTKVHVAVVDSWPSVTEPGNSVHGLGMAGIVEQLACTELGEPAPCNVSTVPHLALDLIALGERRPNKGGYFGFQGRVASAIHEAVTRWQEEASDANLIINLSIGWDRRYNAGNGAAESVPVRAVKEALRYASCKGALIFAAAGNSTGGPTPSEDPIFPAAWEATETARVEMPAGTCVDAPGNAPLLHAVAGVDGHDARLPNGRRDARALLAAPAFAVPVSKSIGGQAELETYTGSSVASAVASAIAASVWSRKGSYKTVGREAIVSALVSGGQLLPDPASFCPGKPNGGCNKITRLSLCRALGVPSTGCPTIDAGAGSNAPLTDQDRMDFEKHAAQVFDASSYTQPLTVSPCTTDVFVDATTGKFDGESPCPTEVYDDEVVGVALWPQPGIPTCPACMLLLYPDVMWIDMAINERLDHEVTPMSLTLSDDIRPLERYDLFDMVGACRPGNVYSVELPRTKLDYRGDFIYASIEWYDPLQRTQTTSSLVIDSLAGP